MEKLDDLALGHIALFLGPKDIVNLGRTCRRLHSVMPPITKCEQEWLGEKFHVFGPGGGHWSPEKYFDTPELRYTVLEMSLTVTWRDQGWGNRKGELFVKLMRPIAFEEPLEIAEFRRLFGIAEHNETTRAVVIDNDPVVTKAREGDFYRFMRNAGGGGGHQLIVRNFQARATLLKVNYR